MNIDWKQLNQQFDGGFESRVLEAVRLDSLKTKGIVRLWSNRMMIAAAACAAILLISTYVNYGVISGDGLMGLAGFNSVDLTETINTYTDLYNE